MSDRLKDKVGLITGAAQGLGKEMAKVMIAQGANIVITDINESILEEAAKELSCEKIVLDVTKEKQWKSVISQIDKQFGSLNILVNKTEKGIVGDVAFDEVSKVVKALTPVPGGVGPMTIACLLKNTIDCFKRSQTK